MLGLLVGFSWSGTAIGAATLLAFLVRTPVKVALVDRRRGRTLPRTRVAWRIALVELIALVGAVGRRHCNSRLDVGRPVRGRHAAVRCGALVRRTQPRSPPHPRAVRRHRHHRRRRRHRHRRRRTGPRLPSRCGRCWQPGRWPRSPSSARRSCRLRHDTPLGATDAFQVAAALDRGRRDDRRPPRHRGGRGRRAAGAGPGDRRSAVPSRRPRSSACVSWRWGSPSSPPLPPASSPST